MIDTLLNLWNILLAVFVGFILGAAREKVLTNIANHKLQKPPKYRVGRNQKRVILEIETGYEFLIFERGREEDCQEYCDYLNNK